jgi:D-arabinose 1-dehydrogenase-like Zn-dependent alcohol dehydrogenase
MKLPATAFLKLPEGLDWKKHPAEIGVISDAIATPVKVIRKARVGYADTVAVFGAGGGLGLHMLQAARWAGAKKVIGVDVMASKFEACGKAGADHCIDATEGRVAEQLRALTQGRGIDVAIDFVGAPECGAAALSAMNKGGRLVLLAGHGKGFNTEALIQRGELEVMGSRYATRQEVIDALDLVARGDLKAIVNEKAPLVEAEAVHQRLDKGLITGRAALMIA